MSKQHDVIIRQADVAFRTIDYRAPFVVGGHPVQSMELVEVTVELESVGGRHTTGFGMMPLGQQWAWQSAMMSPQQTGAVMKAMAEAFVELADAYDDSGHPLLLVDRLSAEYPHQAKVIATRFKAPEPVPPLAYALAGAALDAAVHDGFARLVGKNAFEVLGKEYVTENLGDILGDDFKGEYVAQYLRAKPEATLRVVHSVGWQDPLTRSQVVNPVNDKRPESLDEWIRSDGLHEFKIRLGSASVDENLARLGECLSVIRECVPEALRNDWGVAIDLGGAAPSADAVVELLQRINREHPEVTKRLRYVEQPFQASIDDQSPGDIQKIATQLGSIPLVADESVKDAYSLGRAREVGYTGIALKVAKGHTDALMCVAAAQKYKMALVVQDLTCPGTAFVHSAGLACRVPGVTTLEMNARQYCPDVSLDVTKKYAGLFKVKDGTIQTSGLTQIGLAD